MAIRKRKQAAKTTSPGEDEDPPLTPAQRRALDRFAVPCEVDDRGRLVLNSIADRKVGKIRLAVQPSWKKKRAVRR